MGKEHRIISHHDIIHRHQPPHLRLANLVSPPRTFTQSWHWRCRRGHGATLAPHSPCIPPAPWSEAVHWSFSRHLILHSEDLILLSQRKILCSMTRHTWISYCFFSASSFCCCASLTSADKFHFWSMCFVDRIWFFKDTNGLSFGILEEGKEEEFDQWLAWLTLTMGGGDRSWWDWGREAVER